MDHSKTEYIALIAFSVIYLLSFILLKIVFRIITKIIKNIKIKKGKIRA